MGATIRRILPRLLPALRLAGAFSFELVLLGGRTPPLQKEPGVEVVWLWPSRRPKHSEPWTSTSPPCVYCSWTEITFLSYRPNRIEQVTSSIQHSFIQQIFTDHLSCSRHCSHNLGYMKSCKMAMILALSWNPRVGSSMDCTTQGPPYLSFLMHQIDRVIHVNT